MPRTVNGTGQTPCVNCTLARASGRVCRDSWSITLKNINKTATFNRLRKYKFDRKRWVDNGVAYTKGRVDSRGYVTPNIM